MATSSTYTDPTLGGITRLTNAPAKNGTGSTTPVNDKMGQKEFPTLFTTQLKMQNPLDPVKNEAFVAQLAQFSQLEATTLMGNSMESVAKSIRAERFINGASLIGKQIAAPSGPARLSEGATISGLISLPNGADKVSLDVYDSSGNKVFARSMGRQTPGELRMTWNGRNDAGQQMPEGDYRIVATVTSLGQVTQVPISTPATVRSVTYSAANDDLIVELSNGATVPLSQVSRIDAAPTTP